MSDVLESVIDKAMKSGNDVQPFEIAEAIKQSPELNYNEELVRKVFEHMVPPGTPIAQIILNTKSLTTTPCIVDLAAITGLVKRNGGSIEMTITNKKGEKLDLIELYQSGALIPFSD